MPGTGKTELIIRLIEKFSKMKKTVLITTFTNRSLDNILERLIDSGKIDKEKVIREGAQYACSKTLKEYTSHGVTFASLTDFQKFYDKKTIWFVTLNSLYIHHLPKMFDVAILDEASQCLEPTCI
jgi:superfamily I DNA and/or RNA helicase